jgi:hypothetical protein
MIDERRYTLWGATLWIWFAVLLSGCGESAGVTRAQTGPCAESATVPLSIEMPTCAAAQGVFLVPDALDGMAATAAKIPGCSTLMHDFPKAGTRTRAIRFAVMCQEDRPADETKTDIITLTGLPGNGAIVARPERIVTFDLEDCPVPVTSTEVVCH